ncbi:MAG TPA: G5 domain-containing protein [Candidatus Saccharimonadales bacterium]|nr:G5 domain-containing protein [Candidatus Saccharimonadales bacterium]
MLEKLKDPNGGLSRAGKIVAALVVIVVIGTATAASRPTSQLPNTPQASTPQTLQQVQGEVDEQEPIVETKTITEDVPIPFEKTSVYDATLEQGKTSLKTSGANGMRKITYKITIVDGKETNKEKVSEAVALAPVTEVVALGAKVPAPAPKPIVAPAPQPSNCHASYTGACVPIASDVDCAGGTGNGPAYVAGPVTVIGPDVYDLDRDGNGVGCEG